MCDFRRVVGRGLLFRLLFCCEIPIETIHYDAGEVKDPRLLFVFLHGNGDRNSVFDKEGFIEAARVRGLHVDMISVAGDKDCPKKEGCVPKIYLGYGTKDRFTYAQDLLASLLPPEQVVAIDGGHDWTTWKKLWKRFLDRNIFGR